MTKRKIMRAFKIDELSAVDTPAQEGARMVIMKRSDKKKPVKDDKKKPPFGSKKPSKDDKDKDDKDDKKKPAFLTKMALLTEDHLDGHSHLILGSSEIAGFTSYNGTSDENGHQHPWIKLLDGTVVIGADHGHGHLIRDGIMKMVLTADQLEHLLSSDPDVAKQYNADMEKNIDEGITLKDGSFPIKTPDDMTTALECYDVWGDNPAAIRHIMKRAEVLNVELPNDGELAIVFKNAQLTSEEDLSKENEIMTKKIEKTEDGDFEKQLEDAAVKQTATEAELVVAKQLADMNDVQKAHYADLEADAATDFLAKSADDKDAEIAKANDADAVVFKSIEGTEYHKSDDPRLVAMAKREDARTTKIADLEKAAEDKVLAKRADDELAHMPGTPESKVALLKAVDSIEDEGHREDALKALHASNEKMSKAFDEHGTTSSPASVDAGEELDTLAKTYAKENKTSYSDAYSAVCRTEKGSALYNQSTQV